LIKQQQQYDNTLSIEIKTTAQNRRNTIVI